MSNQIAGGCILPCYMCGSSTGYTWNCPWNPDGPNHQPIMHTDAVVKELQTSLASAQETVKILDEAIKTRNEELAAERERTKELGSALAYMETMNQEKIKLKKDNFCPLRLNLDTIYLKGVSKGKMK